MEVILISPIKKVSYKIDKKNKIKNFKLIGEIFGLNFKSDWKRDYKSAMIFSSWTSTYSILVFMTLVYYYIGMIYATEPGDPEYD